jgi:hypothetical protein
MFNTLGFYVLKAVNMNITILININVISILRQSIKIYDSNYQSIVTWRKSEN